MKKIIVWEIGKMEAKESRHAVNLIDDLNIKYSRSQAYPIADNWVFYDVVLPSDIHLPDYIEFKEN